MGSLVNSTNCLRKKITTVKFGLLQGTETDGILLNSLLAAYITLNSKPDKNIITKENYRLMFLMTVDAKLLNKILVNLVLGLKKNHRPWHLPDNGWN